MKRQISVLRLKTKLILFIAIIHVAFLVLCYLIFEKNRLHFIASEVFVLISLAISAGLYNQLIEPLTYIKEGINAIKDRDFNVKFLLTGKVEVDELVNVYNQMMDALRDERTRQEAQHFFLEKLIHTSPTGIIILDYDNQIRQINPKAAAILGAGSDDFVRQLEPLKPGDAKTIRIGGINTFKVQKSHFIDRGFARVFVMMEELTAEIFEAEKNAYGKVIRMMAHEVNNTVGPVNSIITQALDTSVIWESANSVSLKNAMHIAVERNQNLNLFMRNFADLVKLSPVNRVRVDMVALVHSVVDFMQVSAGKQRIDFKFNLPGDYFASADVQQMEQVLINIIKNAIEAIGSKGTINLTLEPALQKLTICDTGKGISEQSAQQLFNPFFSTKKDGQGIGLTLVREILLNHGFEFSLVTVRPGQTEFVIWFK